MGLIDLLVESPTHMKEYKERKEAGKTQGYSPHTEYPSAKREPPFDWAKWLLDDSGGGGGWSGPSYRPQTAEEAKNLLAQAGLYEAQAADVPLNREMARRGMLAEIGLAQAERAANPRRVFEALYGQARLQPTEMAKGLQEKINIPGFKHGGKVKGAAKGKSVEGPAIVRVGKNDDEYALLMPGSVVAPKPEGEEPTPENASRHIVEQMAEGGVISKAKAREMLAHGEVHGKALTDAQRGLFGLIASGKKPTRLKKAQGGMVARRRADAPGPVPNIPRGTSLTDIFDMMGGRPSPGGVPNTRPSDVGLPPGKTVADIGFGPRFPDRAHPGRSYDDVGLPPGKTAADLPGAFPSSKGGGYPADFGLSPELQAEFDKLREEATGVIMGALEKGTSGTSLYDPLGGSTLTGKRADFLRGMNVRDIRKLSPTQVGALSSMLSAHRTDPEDYFTSIRRQFEGFNPVTAGTRARFSGILGRR